MSKKIVISFDRKTGKIAVNMNGYDGGECGEDLKRLLENLKAFGVNVKIEDIDFKKPQLPEDAEKEKIKE